MRLLKILLLAGLVAAAAAPLGACKDIGEGLQSIGRAIS